MVAPPAGTTRVSGCTGPWLMRRDSFSTAVYHRTYISRYHRNTTRRAGTHQVRQLLEDLEAGHVLEDGPRAAELGEHARVHGGVAEHVQRADGERVARGVRAGGDEEDGLVAEHAVRRDVRGVLEELVVDRRVRVVCERLRVGLDFVDLRVEELSAQSRVSAW